jgi:hypothetical protein
MSKLFRKTLLSFLASFVLILGLVSPAMAQTTNPPASVTGPWYSQDFGSWWVKVYGNTTNQNEIFGERYTAAQVQWVIYGLFSFFMNPFLNAVCSGNATALFSGSIGSFGKGCATSSAKTAPKLATKEAKGNLLSAVFADRAFSGVTYSKDLIRKFHIIPQAKAQSAGFGYGALDPVRTLWMATRNVAYVLFVLVTLVLAFMIMFRVKISPQVVVSVQSALPKIAIGLVLVTFSYAIAGFLIDLMYVFIGLISIIFAGTNLLSSNNPVTLFGYLTTGFNNSGIFGFLMLYFVQFLSSFLVIAMNIVVTSISSIVSGATAAAGSTSNPLAAAAIVGIGVLDASGIGAVMSSIFIIIAVILFIGMFVILLIMSVKILLTLIKSFAYILFLTIVLPLQITLGIVVPNIGFGTWLRQFVSNLAVFPITGTLFLLAFIFMQQGRTFAENTLGSTNTNPGWPPLIGISNGGIAIAFLFASFFIISMVPKAAEVANAIITGKGNYGNAIGEAMSPISSPASAYLEGHSRKHAGTFVGALTGTAAGVLKGR